MKGVIFVIAFVFCCLLPASTVYAGSLNEYEKQVVSEAKKSYVYEGKEYHLSESSLGQLTTYLSQDDVDITAEQRDQLIQTAYASIEQGVLEGYLIPVDETKEETEATPKITKVPEKTSQVTGEAADAKSEPPIPKIADTKQQPQISAAPPKVAPDASGKAQITEKPLTEKEEIAKLFEAILSEEKTKQTRPSGGTAVNASMITETGYSFNTTLIVIVGIMMLMIFGFVAAIRSNFFAHNDE